jgi:NADH-quinone oxidoreductase subunit J
MGTDTVEAVVFVACAMIVLAGAFGVIWFRNPVHSALSLVATLFGVAVLFLNMNAQFLAAVQIIVYTGAIVVLILFVIMLLGVDTADDIDTEPLAGQRMIALVIAAGVAGLVVAGVTIVGDELVSGARSVTAAISEDVPNVEQIGRVLFTEYVYALEITAVLLTIAVVAAVVMARKPTEVEPLPTDNASMDPPEPVELEAEEVFD